VTEEHENLESGWRGLPITMTEC